MALKLLWLAERQTLPADKELCVEASDLIEKLFNQCDRLEEQLGLEVRETALDD